MPGKPRYTPNQESQIIRAYQSGKTTLEVGHEFDCSDETVRRILIRNNMRPRLKGHIWQGKRMISTKGYVLISVRPDDELSCMMNKANQVAEHRIIMARHLGRPLTNNETVHHINGVRDDNRIENLQLRIGHHGQGQSYCCADCGSTRLNAIDL